MWSALARARSPPVAITGSRTFVVLIKFKKIDTHDNRTISSNSSVGPGSLTSKKLGNDISGLFPVTIRRTGLGVRLSPSGEMLAERWTHAVPGDVTDRRPATTWPALQLIVYARYILNYVYGYIILFICRAYEYMGTCEFYIVLFNDVLKYIHILNLKI